MKSGTAKRTAKRSAKSRTADLFAKTTTVLPAAAALPPALAPVRFVAPQVRPLHRQLWYAAVFAHPIEPQQLQKLCLHAQAFTSFVSIELPDALLLEIKGSVKLFGSLETLHERIDACWRQLSLTAHSSTAPSTLAALWLARAGKAVHTEDLKTLPGLLAALPIVCTAWDIDRLNTLRAMGVTRIGELLRLPRAGLARRLGTGTLRDIDIATGRQFAPRRAFVARERFRERCDFETEIEHIGYLEKALEPLIERCARFLRHRQAGIQRLQLRLRHRDLPFTCVRLGLASITSERRRIADVLLQKLGRMELKAPVRGMELISGSLLALSASSLDVFTAAAGNGGSGCDTAPQLVERLRARLGEGAVYGVSLVAEHRPEAAWQRVQELHLTSTPMQSARAFESVDVPMPRPVWLLENPLPLMEPGILQGPERIESGWWDGHGVARDYYIARQPHGAKLWVFQERQSKRWFLHGVFA